VGGVCRCTATATTTAAPVVTTTAAPGCFCRDFRGRCTSALYCLGLI
jgi:hypothetical protein